MGNFNQGDNNKGGFRSGRRDFGQPNFSKKNWVGQNSGDRQTVMHPAVCSNCGKDCEVPFRPSNGKPVYCKECFGDKRNSDGGGDRQRRNEFAGRPQAKPHFDGGRGNDDIKKQLDGINIKLDRLIHSIDALTQKKLSQEKVIDASASTLKKTIKKAAKKPSKKTKK